MHRREVDKTSAITKRAPVRITPKGSVGLSPRQEFWRRKEQEGWPAWMIDEKWQALEAAKKAAQAAGQAPGAKKKRT